MKNASFSPRRRHHRRRGVALLLVMVGLVVCTLLIAGFLSTQGTSIGIARNERDAQKGRNCAQSGIDLCYWLIQNRSDWRTAMSPGLWLNNAAVGDGTVSVTAADGGSTGTFTSDPTSPVLLTAVGTAGGRSFTLTCRVTPTGGGTVFRGGAFALGQLILHNSASVDSYNSSVASYNAAAPGTNALFASNFNGTGALTMDGSSSFRGSFVGGPVSSLGNIVNALLGLLIPSSTSQAAQSYIPGQIVPPNTVGLPTFGALSISAGPGGTVPVAPGQYTSISVNSGNARLQSGTYRITGALTNASALVVPTGSTVNMVVSGALTSASSIQVQGTGVLNIYFANTATLSGSVSSAGGAANLRFLGLASATNLTIKNSGNVTASIFAPQASIYLTGTSKLFGAMVAHDVTMDTSAAFHYDEATKNIRIDNITGGSAPQGTADYVLYRVGAS